MEQIDFKNNKNKKVERKIISNNDNVDEERKLNDFSVINYFHKNSKNLN